MVKYYKVNRLLGAVHSRGYLPDASVWERTLEEEEEEEEILLNFPHLRIPWHTTLYPGTRPLQTSTRTN